MSSLAHVSRYRHNRVLARAEHQPAPPCNATTILHATGNAKAKRFSAASHPITITVPDHGPEMPTEETANTRRDLALASHLNEAEGNRFMTAQPQPHPTFRIALRAPHEQPRITTDSLGLLSASRHQQGATRRVGDLETAWDASQARDNATWNLIDGKKIYTGPIGLRATNPDTTTETAALNDLLADLK